MHKRILWNMDKIRALIIELIRRKFAYRDDVKVSVHYQNSVVCFHAANGGIIDGIWQVQVKIGHRWNIFRRKCLV